jgi:hypothetical protein
VPDFATWLKLAQLNGECEVLLAARQPALSISYSEFAPSSSLVAIKPGTKQVLKGSDACPLNGVYKKTNM